MAIGKIKSTELIKKHIILRNKWADSLKPKPYKKYSRQISMVEYVNLEKDKPKKKITDKQRINLIILTYVSNFMLYVVLYDLFQSRILKILTFILIISFASQMLAQKISISAINGWTIIFLIINLFSFGVTSLIFSYNLIMILINLLYFKYIVKRVSLK